MKKELIAIVNGKDEILGYKPRDLVDAEKLRYRVSALWITNSKGEILLSRRAYTKSHDPGKWGPAVAGTVEKGETYSDNVTKEAREELDLKGIEFKQGLKVKHEGEHKYFAQWFLCTVNRPAKEFRVQKKEVAEVKWFPKHVLKEQFKENPQEFLKGFGETLDLFENEQ